MTQDQKKLPWFKFTPNEWLTGSIVGEDMCSQGLFINICAYYWKEGGNVPMSKIERRYSKYDAFDLIKREYLKANKGIVNIKFLDEQLSEYEQDRKLDSENGKKGAQKRWGGHGVAINGHKPNIADIDIDIELELEEKNKKDISEFSGKKIKTDDRITKELKKLDKKGIISLSETEAQYFSGQGTESVIIAFQIDFFERDKKYYAGTAIETSFKGWVNRLSIETLSGKLKKEITPITKLTPQQESEYAKFLKIRHRHGEIGNFLNLESSEEKESLIKLLIAKYGLSELIRKIYEYSIQSTMGSTYNSISHFKAWEPNLKIPDKEWEEIVKGQELEEALKN